MIFGTPVVIAEAHTMCVPLPKELNGHHQDPLCWSRTPSSSSSPMSGKGEGIEEAPLDGNYYVRSMGQWVNLVDALVDLGITPPAVDTDLDGGDFTDDTSDAVSNNGYDGGNFTSGATEAENNIEKDGGSFTPDPDDVKTLDAGDFDSGSSVATDSLIVDGGNFDTGVGAAADDEDYEGGNFNG